MSNDMTMDTAMDTAMDIGMDTAMGSLTQTITIAQEVSPTQIHAISAETNKPLHLIQEFVSFLASVDSQPPIEDEVDLFLLFREMAELKNEAKLESRHVKNTLDSHKELIGLLKSNNALFSDQLAQQGELFVKFKDQQRKELARELITFCDYLELSLQNMTSSPKDRWRSTRSSTGKFIKGMIEGQTLLVGRFTALLKSLNVTSMTVIDKPIDPLIMRVAEVCSKRDRPNGIVIAELQKGYFIDDTVLRLAEVVVNKININEEN